MKMFIKLTKSSTSLVLCIFLTISLAMGCLFPQQALAKAISIHREKRGEKLLDQGAFEEAYKAFTLATSENVVRGEKLVKLMLFQFVCLANLGHPLEAFQLLQAVYDICPEKISEILSEEHSILTRHLRQPMMIYYHHELLTDKSPEEIDKQSLALELTGGNGNKLLFKNGELNHHYLSAGVYDGLVTSFSFDKVNEEIYRFKILAPIGIDGDYSKAWTVCLFETNNFASSKILSTTLIVLTGVFGFMGAAAISTGNASLVGLYFGLSGLCFLLWMISVGTDDETKTIFKAGNNDAIDKTFIIPSVDSLNYKVSDRHGLTFDQRSLSLSGWSTKRMTELNEPKWASAIGLAATAVGFVFLMTGDLVSTVISFSVAGVMALIVVINFFVDPENHVPPASIDGKAFGEGLLLIPQDSREPIVAPKA